MDEQRKTELIAAIDRTRSRVAANRQALEEDLKVGERFKENVERHRLSWLGGAAITGLVLAKLPPRTKKVVVDRHGKRTPAVTEEMGKAGLAMWLVRTAIDAAKPALLAWATQRMGKVVDVTEQVHEKVERVDQKT